MLCEEKFKIKICTVGDKKKEKQQKLRKSTNKSENEETLLFLINFKLVYLCMREILNNNQ